MDNVEPTEQPQEAEAVEQPKEVTAQEFIERYKRLVEETGYQIVVNPAFASTNHGTFEVVLQTSVGKAPKQTE